MVFEILQTNNSSEMYRIDAHVDLIFTVETKEIPLNKLEAEFERFHEEFLGFIEEKSFSTELKEEFKKRFLKWFEWAISSAEKQQFGYRLNRSIHYEKEVSD